MKKNLFKTSLILAAILITNASKAQGGSFEFLQNKGQVADQNGALHPEVLYLSSSQGANVFITKSGINYVYANHTGKFTRDLGPNPALVDTTVKDSLTKISLQFVNANPLVQVIAEQQTSGTVNYLLYNNNVTGVLGFQKITYVNLWNNIDLVITNANGLNYLFNVKSGGNYRDIKFAFAGAARAVLNSQGITVNTFFNQTINFPVPVVSSPVGGLSLLHAAYVSNSNNYSISLDGGIFGQSTFDTPILSFGIGNTGPVICTSCPATINTPTEWVTYFGGNDHDFIENNYVDGNGNLYFTGNTLSIHKGATGGYTFPIYNPYMDGNGIPATKRAATYSPLTAFVTKFNKAHQRVFSTYLSSSGNDFGSDVVAADDGTVYIAGASGSSDFGGPNAPIPTAYEYGPQCGVLVKLRSNGRNIDNITYFPSNYDYTTLTSVALDKLGNVYVGGAARSFSASAHGILRDPGNGAYEQTTVDGSNSGFGANKYDGFIVRLNTSDLDRTWGTYFGGLGKDWIYGIAVDQQNNVIVSGVTESTALNSNEFTIGQQIPVKQFNSSYAHTNFGGKDAFVAKFDVNANLVWSTLFGGSKDDFSDIPYVVPTATITNNYTNVMAVDADGNIYITGGTNSPDFSTKNSNGFFQPNLKGINDAFITKFDKDGQMNWSTYIGGTGFDEGSCVQTVSNGDVYVCGRTTSTNFPVTGSVFTTVLNNNADPYGQFNSAGGSEGYLMHFTNAAVLANSGYFGGQSDEFNSAIFYDEINHSLYIQGGTESNSTTFPYRFYAGSDFNQDFKVQGDFDGYIGSFFNVATTIDTRPRRVAQTADKENGQGSFTLYPNPSDGSVLLSLNNLGGQHCAIEIYNTLGTKVFEKNADNVESSTNMQLDLSKLAKGFYLLRLNVGEDHYTKHIILKK